MASIFLMNADWEVDEQQITNVSLTSMVLLLFFLNEDHGCVQNPLLLTI